MKTVEFNVTDATLTSLIANAQGIIQLIDERAPLLIDTATYQALRKAIVGMGTEDVGRDMSPMPSLQRDVDTPESEADSR